MNPRHLSAQPSVSLRLDATGALIVFAVSWLAFASTLGHGFVWDDLAFFPPDGTLTAVRNPWAFFTARLWSFSRIHLVADVHRPVVALVLWALGPVLGNSPAWWHAFAVFLHAASSTLVYFLARRLAPELRLAASLAAGVLFAVHPVHTEAVAWVMAFTHPLATVLVLAAAHAQLTYARGGGWGWLVASALSSSAAMLTNEVAFATPALLAGIEWLGRGRRPTAPIALALVMPAVVSMSLRALAGAATPNLSAGWRELGRGLSFAAAYVRESLFPWPQRAYVRLPPGWSASWSTLVVAGLSLAGAAAMVVRLRSAERPLPLLGLGWFAASLAPALAAAAHANPMFAPRALYLPSVGLALVVTWAAGRLGPKARLLTPAIAAVAAGGIALTALASDAWKDEMTLRRMMLEGDPTNSGLHLELGRLHDERGETQGALHHLEAALAHAGSPDERAPALELLGTHHAIAGRLDLAEPLLRGAVQEAPGRSSAWLALGNVAYLHGDLPKAREHFAEAYRLDPASYEAVYNLSLVSKALGDFASAERYARLAATLEAP